MSETVKKMLKYPTSNTVKALNPGFFNKTEERIKRSLERQVPPGHILGANDVRYALSDTKPPINDPGAIAPHFMRPSTDEEKLNKTEKAYLGVLRSSGHHWIGIQCISLKLGDDCRYNPDFLVLTVNGVLEAHEVKGFMREDALVKLKTCARMYRWLRIILVQRVQGQWASSLVKP